MGSPTAHSTIQPSPYTNTILFPFQHTNVTSTAAKPSSTKSLYPPSTKTSTQHGCQMSRQKNQRKKKRYIKNNLKRKEEIAHHLLKLKYNTILSSTTKKSY